MHKKSLEEVDIPLYIEVHPAGEYLLNIWRKLHLTRQYSDLGPQPITMDSIYYYFKLTEYEPIVSMQWEIDTLMTLDTVWLNEFYLAKRENRRG